MADLEISHATLDHTGLTGAGTPQALDTTDSPQFAGVNVGHASDTTLARASAGNLTVEGNALYRAGGTDVPVTDGGTGASTASTALANLGGQTDLSGLSLSDVGTPASGDLILLQDVSASSALKVAQFSVFGGSSGTFVLLADSLLGADTASFDFTSISGSYKHLKIILQGRSTKSATNDTVNLKLNNDSGSNYDFLFFTEGSSTSYGTGSGGMVETFGGTSVRIMDAPAASSSAGDSANMELVLPDYASTTFNKTAYATGGPLFDRSAGLIRVHRCFMSWRNTAAITRVTITPAGGNWKAGSRATLYGLS